MDIYKYLQGGWQSEDKEHKLLFADTDEDQKTFYWNYKERIFTAIGNPSNFILDVRDTDGAKSFSGRFITYNALTLNIDGKTIRFLRT